MIYKKFVGRVPKKNSSTLSKNSTQPAAEVLDLADAVKLVHKRGVRIAIICIYLIFTQKHKVQPSLMAGHSLGEYSALVAAEVLDLADAVKLVHKRGQLMQEAVPTGIGAMAAILGKSDEEVESLCKKISSAENIVSAANFNCDGQIVQVSGHKEGC